MLGYSKRRLLFRFNTKRNFCDFSNERLLCRSMLDMVGVLDVNEEDIRHSNEFVKKALVDYKLQGSLAALELGAGIGRITFGCLFNFFDFVDVLEPNRDYIQALLHRNERFNKTIRNVYPQRIEEMNILDYVRYDVVYIHWVLDNIVDNSILEKILCSVCRNISLGSVVIVKENISDSDEDYMLKDGSLVRSKSTFERSFNSAGLSISEYSKVSYESKSEEIFDLGCWILRLT